jgi:hypothetical protein
LWLKILEIWSLQVGSQDLQGRVYDGVPCSHLTLYQEAPQETSAL